MADAYVQPAIDPDDLRCDLVRPGDPRFGLIWEHPERMSGQPCFFGTRLLEDQ